MWENRATTAARGETGTVDAGAPSVRDRGLDGGFVLGVFGAVLVSGEVAAVAMAKAVDGLHPGERRRGPCLQRMALQQQIARFTATQPQPQRMLRCRNRRPRIGQVGEPA